MAVDDTVAPQAMTYLPNYQKAYKVPVVPGTDNTVFLGDVASSQHLDPEKVITCGFVRMEKGKPLTYKYEYHECKIILEGSFKITDETGRSVHATPGDVFFFPKGATVVFETDDFGLAFLTAQRQPQGL